VEQTEGWSGAEIELLCRKATMTAIRALVEKRGEEVAPHELHISARDFKQAMEEVKAQRAFKPLL
jgi:SpoVK/Ycf46/Vps4 family AAA+-type ATPase